MDVHILPMAENCILQYPVIGRLAEALRSERFAEFCQIDVVGGQVYAKCASTEIGVLATLTTFSDAEIPRFIAVLESTQSRRAE